MQASSTMKGSIEWRITVRLLIQLREGKIILKNNAVVYKFKIYLQQAICIKDAKIRYDATQVKITV